MLSLNTLLNFSNSYVKQQFLVLLVLQQKGTFLCGATSYHYGFAISCLTKNASDAFLLLIQYPARLIFSEGRGQLPRPGIHLHLFLRHCRGSRLNWSPSMTSSSPNFQFAFKTAEQLIFHQYLFFLLRVNRVLAVRKARKEIQEKR